MFHFLQILLTLPIRFFFPTKVVGRKNIPNGACIIAGNHTSNLDAPILAVHTWEKKYYLAKKELYQNKFMAFFMKRIGTIKVDREISDLSAIKQSLKTLKDNKKLVIYPEGTRVHNKDMSLGEIKSGVAMLAIKAKVPVVPMFMTKQPKLFRRNKLIIGKPFYLDSFYGKKIDNELLAQATEMIKNSIDQLRIDYFNSLTKTKKVDKIETKE